MPQGFGRHRSCVAPFVAVPTLLVPVALVVPFLSLVLRRRVNRILNIVVAPGLRCQQHRVVYRRGSGPATSSDSTRAVTATRCGSGSGRSSRRAASPPGCGWPRPCACSPRSTRTRSSRRRSFEGLGLLYRRNVAYADLSAPSILPSTPPRARATSPRPTRRSPRSRRRRLGREHERVDGTSRSGARVPGRSPAPMPS